MVGRNFCVKSPTKSPLQPEGGGVVGQHNDRCIIIIQLTCSLLGGFLLADSPLDEKATSKLTGFRTPSSLVDRSSCGEETASALELSPSEAPLVSGASLSLELFCDSGRLPGFSSTSVLSSVLLIASLGLIGGDGACCKELPVAVLSLIVTGDFATTAAFEDPQPMLITDSISPLYTSLYNWFICVGMTTRQ